MVNPANPEYSTVTATVTATGTGTATETVVSTTTTVAADLNDCPTVGLAAGLGVPLALALAGLITTTILCLRRPRRIRPRRSGRAPDIGGGQPLTH
jgi:hypothetical protein